ncbi:hypothetical protein HGRIS_000915 [Hohenbuehelia grisea]|uniref:Uncharacterized protein n=1 Tax=Hohenbuehelia grisea TaxID=104357 RepID=A0ABR3IQ64_9AGAR
MAEAMTSTLTAQSFNPDGIPMEGVVGTSAGVSQAGAAPLTPVKRKPGRPKGSGKKHFLGTDEPKVKRPVGRPRKDGLPAGSLNATRRPSVGVSRSPRKSTEGIQPGPSAPIASSSSNVVPMSHWPAPTPSHDLAPAFVVDPSLDRDDWAELLITKPNTFLLALLSSLASPNPMSTAGPSVDDAFKSHLGSLSQSKGGQNIPTLYSILKTFWLPASPAYFSLTASASTARTPSEHRFFHWDPQPLVFNGISCPVCSSSMINRGRIRTGPIKVYDLDKPFFIIGCEYVCKSAACLKSFPEGGRKFASTDAQILRSLPAKLKDEFPAHLLQGESDSGSGANIWNWKAMGVSRALWNMVKGGLRAGLSKEVIVQLIRSIQLGVPDEVERKEEHDSGPEIDEPDQILADSDAAEVEQLAIHDNAQSAEPDPNDAYNKAWNANAAVAESSGASNQPPPADAATPNHDHSGTAAPAAPMAAPPAASPAPAPAPIPPPAVPNVQYAFLQSRQFSNFPLAFTPYGYVTTPTPTPTPAAPIPTMNGEQPPAPSAGGDITSASMAHQPSASASRRGFSFAVSTPVPAGNPAQSGSGPLETVSKRAPRHCCKCGSQDCKGKGGRSFCNRPCQDCRKLECKGRNSRRPDKSCAEAWS